MSRLSHPDTDGAKDPAAHLLQRIEEVHDSLSPNDRKVADYLVLAYPNSAWHTVEDVAKKAGVSKSAVVRFAARLGYDGFTALQRELQNEVADLLASPLSLMQERAPAPGDDLLDAMLTRSIESLMRTRRRISTGMIRDLAERLAAARTTYIVGFGKSFGMAAYAGRQLATVMPGIRLVRSDESTFPDALLDMGPQDVVLAITVRRYATMTLKVLDCARDAGAYVVVVTDSIASPANPYADRVLVASTDGVSLFDSAIPLVYLIESLVNTVPMIDQRSLDRLKLGETLAGRFSATKSREKRDNSTYEET